MVKLETMLLTLTTIVSVSLSVSFRNVFFFFPLLYISKFFSVVAMVDEGDDMMGELDSPPVDNAGRCREIESAREGTLDIQVERSLGSSSLTNAYGSN